MKSFRRARVSWVSENYLGPEYDGEFKADVFINGNAAVINQGDNRVDRLTNVSVSTVKDPKKKGAEITEVKGRSSYMREMNLHPEDQIVTFRVSGGACMGC